MKTVEGNRTLRFSVRVRFLLFYYELNTIDQWRNMLQNLLGRKKYEEAMSDEHPPVIQFFYLIVNKSFIIIPGIHINNITQNLC